MKRTFAIGDIHGGLKALKEILEAAKVTKADELIFLGDYVDGWSESAQVIDFLIDLDSNYNCRFILGNHDAYCADWLREDIRNDIWLRHGGEETMKSYASYSESQRKEHLSFFDRMKNFYIDHQNRLFIHAGFTSMHGPSKETYASNYIWDRTLWELAVAMHDRLHPDDPCYPARLKLFSAIFIGHTPTIHLNIEFPWKRANVWNVDTGAAFTGRLSILDINSGQYWQSERVMDLYPNEVGRNKK